MKMTHTHRLAFASGRRYPWYHPSNLQWFWRECSAFVERGLYGVARMDVISLDWYLVTWLPDALRHMARRAHSHPPNMTMAEWQCLLETMAQGFAAGHALRECRYSPHSAAEVEACQQVAVGWEAFSHYFDHLWL